jgi:hypothetical protein
MLLFRYKKTAAYFAKEIFVHPRYHPEKHKHDDMARQILSIGGNKMHLKQLLISGSDQTGPCIGVF